MPLRTIAEIAGVGVFDQHVEKRVSTDLVRQRERRGLVDPHQGGVNHETAFHPQIERQLHAFDRVVATIRITGEVGLTHARDQMLHSPPIGERTREGEENEFTPGTEGRRPPTRARLDGDLARERGIGNRRERAQLEHVILAEFFGPYRLKLRHTLAHAPARLELGAMALLVIKAQRLDASKALERPGQADRPAPPPGKQNNPPCALLLIPQPTPPPPNRTPPLPPSP